MLIVELHRFSSVDLHYVRAANNVFLRTSAKQLFVVLTHCGNSRRRSAVLCQIPRSRTYRSEVRRTNMTMTMRSLGWFATSINSFAVSFYVRH